MFIKKVFLIIGIIITVYTLSIVFVNGLYLKKTYQDAYKYDNILKYDDVRKQVISFGVLAPSSHNLQPWKIVLDEDSSKFHLYIDESRTIPFVDSNYNQMVISSGTFLSYIEEGAKNLGYTASFDLFPNGTLPDNPSIDDIKSTIIATISITENNSSNIYDFDAFSSSTVRLPYTEDIVTSETKNAFKAINTLSNVSFDFINDNELDDFKSLLIEGVRIESTSKEAMTETDNLFRYSNRDKVNNPFGLSLHSGSTNSFMRINMEFFSKLMPLSIEAQGEFWLTSETVSINSSSAFGIITGDSSRMSQLETGILFGKISLYASSISIKVQPIVQVTESYEDMYNQYTLAKTQYGNGENIYMIFRMGYCNDEVSQGIRFTANDIIS